MKKFFSLLLSLTVVLGGVFTIFPSQTFAADFKFPEEHQKALEYLNEIRRAVGVREVVLDPYLTEAAQNHANYLKVNKLTDSDYLRRNNIDAHSEMQKILVLLEVLRRSGLGQSVTMQLPLLARLFIMEVVIL